MLTPEQFNDVSKVDWLVKHDWPKKILYGWIKPQLKYYCETYSDVFGAYCDTHLGGRTAVGIDKQIWEELKRLSKEREQKIKEAKPDKNARIL